MGGWCQLKSDAKYRKPFHFGMAVTAFFSNIIKTIDDECDTLGKQKTIGYIMLTKKRV